MNTSVIWTVVSSICTAVSCIVALSLGVWNVVHSRKYEKRQRQREIRDKALDAAVQMCTAHFRILLAAEEESTVPFTAQICSLCEALRAYGYSVDFNPLISHSDDDAAAEELGKLLDAIISDFD